MSNSKLWQIRYRVHDNNDILYYHNKLSDISDAKVHLTVAHRGSETIFATATDALDTTATHIHILFETAIPCSLYKAKQLIQRSGVYTESPGSNLGSRDYSISVATDISGAVSYFLWEFARTSTKLSFTKGNVITSESIEITPEIISKSNEHYEAKRFNYNRKHKRATTDRTTVLQSFYERYASGCNETLERISVDYSQAMHDKKIRVSNFMQEQDIINIWSYNNPKRLKQLAISRAERLSEKYNIPLH